MAAEVQNVSEDSQPISGINVTPFVDVVLVLLVIFMVTAPTLMNEVMDLKLPKATNTQSTAQTESIGVAITRQGQILLNGQITDENTLKDFVISSFQKNPMVQVLISADAESRHAELVRVIDLVKGAGVSRFALQVSKQESN